MEEKHNQFQPPAQGPPPPYNQNPAIGFQPQGQASYQPAPPMYSTNNATVIAAQPMVNTQPVITQPMIMMAGGNCPACRSGILMNEFTCCGICLGICFFPLGLLCCFLMRERKCTNCRASFGGA